MSLVNFQEYCSENPETLDVLCRLTLGPYDSENQRKQKANSVDEQGQTQEGTNSKYQNNGDTSVIQEEPEDKERDELVDDRSPYNDENPFDVGD